MRHSLAVAVVAAAGSTLLFSSDARGQHWGGSAAVSMAFTSMEPLGASIQPPMIVERGTVSAGVTYRARPLSRVRVQPELWLFDRGSDGVHVLYAELPVFLQMLPLSPRTHRVVPTFALGAGPAVRLRCTWSDRPGHTPPGRGKCADTGGSFFDFRTRPFDFGAGGGLGVESRAPGGSRLSVDARVWLGLMDVGYLEDFRRTNGAVSLVANVTR